MPVISDTEWQAQSDLNTMVEAKEVQKDPGRMAAAKSFAERQAEKFQQLGAEIPSPPKKSFNGAVSGSRMEVS